MAVALLHAYKAVSCTDQLCTWSRPRMSAAVNEVCTVADLYPDVPTATVDRSVLDDDRSALLNSLQKVNQQCPLAWFLSSEPPAAGCTVPTLTEIIASLADSSKHLQIDELMCKLPLSKEQLANIEENTRMQQDNPLWRLYRPGRITASNFGNVIKCLEANRKPSPSLLKTLLGEYNAAGARPVQWGQVHEKTAVERYEAETDVQVKPSGLWLHEYGFCGASPDGIVDDMKIIEVKCPFTVQDKNVLDHVGDDFFLNIDTDGSLSLNLSNHQGHSYCHQIQGNLWLTGRSVCDLVVWTTQSLLILSVQKDEQYSDKYLNLLQKFY